MAKSMKLGGGGRFQKMEKGLERKGYSEGSAKAITASHGIKTLGQKKMTSLAKAGRKRVEKE
jgi:hypothetical protein